MDYLKSLLLAALVLLCVAGSSAADVDASSARDYAMRFVQSRNSGKYMAPGSLDLRLAHTEWSVARAGSADYYVFNDEGGKAFVIVAGDDRGERILAYGDHTFDVRNIPINVQWWLDQYKAQIEWQASQAVEDNVGIVSPQLRSPSSDLTISPLVSARWSQGVPYCNQCPVYNGEYCATGCVATAMAQVMYYWRFPNRLPALPGYVTSYLNISLPDLPGTRVNWKNMLDNYNMNYNDAQADAVATLIRYCGQACFMDYSPDGSGAYEMQQLVALVTFGYNPEAQCLYRDEINDDERWEEMLVEDLSAGRPILYCGNDMSSGHAFILDGCSGGMYHVNWGWGGYYDGYYALDALGGGDWQFNYGHSMLYHLYPNSDGDVTPLYDFEAAGIYYKIDGDAVSVVNRDMTMNSYSGNVVIPESVSHEGKTYAVTSIKPNAFMNSLGLTSVTVPASIKNIGSYAFYNCPSLSEVRIHGTGKTIADGAFSGCVQLRAMYIDDIESWCGITLTSFYSNPMLFGALLYDQTGQPLEDIVIPASVKHISDYAFTYCPNLRSVTLAEGITSVGYCAFYGSRSMTSLSVPGSLQQWGEFAFSDTGLRSLALHEGITTIGETAFCYCDQLTHVDIPNSVNRVDFCSFAYCDGLESINLGQGLTNIGDYAFYDCTSLLSVTLPNSVTSMGFGAFAMDGALTTVNLSDQLAYMADAAFYGCRSLTDITSPAIVPPTLNDRTAFNEATYSRCTLHVPLQSMEAYQKAVVWGYFTSIVGINSAAAQADVNGDGTVNIDDVSALIDLLLLDGRPTCGDVDGSGEVDIMDVSALIEYLLTAP